MLSLTLTHFTSIREPELRSFPRKRESSSLAKGLGTRFRGDERRTADDANFRAIVKA